MTADDATWRSTNLGARLFAASGRLIAVKLAAVHAAGFAEVSAAQLALFHGLDPTGTRLTTLATRARLSKASMAELVDRAAATGLVVRRADPADARGRIVTATPTGTTLLAALDRGIALADADALAALGPVAAARLRDALRDYLVTGVVTAATNHVTCDATAAPANFGRLVALAAACFTAAVAATLAEQGIAVSPALLGTVRHVDLGGSRLTDLAASARMTKPAMRELVDRGEALGFVARTPDPADRRARRIVFTPAGLDLLAAVRVAVAAAEASLAATIGTTAATDLAAALVRLTAADLRAAA